MQKLEIAYRIQSYKPFAVNLLESSQVPSTGLLRRETDSALDSRSALSLVVITVLRTVEGA
jgi:hypothetical protein